MMTKYTIRKLQINDSKQKKTKLYSVILKISLRIANFNSAHWTPFKKKIFHSDYNEHVIKIVCVFLSNFHLF